MTDNSHSIELTIGNTSLGVSGSREFVQEQFYDLYEKHGFDSIDVPESAIEVSGGESNGISIEDEEQQSEETEPIVDASLNELLSDSEVKTKQDTTLVVAWYLIAARGQSDVALVDVREEAERSQVELGEKVPRDLRSNIGKGYLGPTGEQREDADTYEVTETGREHLREKGIPA